MEKALIISLIVLFIHSTTWEGMIFNRIQNIIPTDRWLWKPIYGCPICMTPWYGTIIYWIFFHISFSDYLLTIGGASGLSVIWVCLVSIKESLENNFDN